MATAAEQVAASQVRERIPTEWLKELQTWSDAALLSWAETAVGDSAVYAGWEMDYRIAFNRHVGDGSDNLRETAKRKGENDAL